ncbi:S24/S26 family peptidase [Nesterenkonia halotolerans]|uniref:Signal peptidase n=1 Tax=Nesterenkonia halotolerans TaxID=225325 RepID=A0ABR9J783_9MICC|nr:hypothetical protein [Nesterenkonia halotolerans]MBE1514709.1 signal peptidase [Nesterenkonia halotolerans]
MTARLRFWLTETLLWVAAAAGLLAVLLVGAAYFFNISLIMFRTGSMEPTIPTGAVAVVQEVKASSVEVGDILTIDRAGQLPVTHRVTSVAPGESATTRVVTMRGDANESDDPFPYVITEARKVLWSVPGLANTINQLGNPYVLGGVTVGVALLVGWAFWPQSPPAAPRHAPASAARRRRRSHSGALLLVAATGATGATLMTPIPASATNNSGAVVRESASSEYVSLRSAYVPGQRINMRPGDKARWDIDVSLTPPETLRGRAGLSMAGDFPLRVTITSCDQAWSDGPTSTSTPGEACPGDAEVLLKSETLASTEKVNWLDEFSSAENVWLRVDTTLPVEETVSADSTAVVRVHAEVAGDEISMSTGGDSASGDDSAAAAADPEGGPGNLAQTGVNYLGLLILALALMVIGKVMHSRRNTHGPQDGGEYS